MTPAEFEKKLQSLPEVEPDETDLAMLAEGERINDAQSSQKIKSGGQRRRCKFKPVYSLQTGTIERS